MVENNTRKFLPALLLTTTTSVSAVLVALRHRWSTGALDNFVVHNRDTTALVVQILSSILGLCQFYAACSALNFSTRLHLEKRSVSLQTLNFWSAIVAPRMDFSLSILMLVPLSIWCMVVQVPGALWAGALTPLFVTVAMETGYISVPAYPLNASKFWDNEYVRYSDGHVDRYIICTKTSDTPSWTGPFVSTCPDLDFIASLIASTGSATSTSDSSPWVHPSMINRDWSFVGRSYGVGSTPGLLDLPNAMPVPFTAYNYIENGYFTKVTCAKNESAAYTVKSLGVFGNTTDTKLELWVANGTLPNSVPGSFESYPLATYTASNRGNIFAWSAVVNNGQNMIGVATPPGTWYDNQFGKMQCTVEFQPSLFAVAVNLTTKTTMVTPISTIHGQNITDIEPTGNLTAHVMLSLDRLSRISSQFDISTLGDPIGWNVLNVNLSMQNLTYGEAHARGLENSITALLDNLLGAFGAVELVIANSTKQTPFFGSYEAVKIGSDKYIFATLGVNIVLLLSFVAEIVRTRFWRGLTKFDYSDMKSVIVASSAGGTSIADAYYDGRKTEIKLKLVEDEMGVALINTSRYKETEDTKNESQSALVEL